MNPLIDLISSVRWCTGALNDEGENEEKANALNTLQLWLLLLRYAFTARNRRIFSTSPVLAIHSAPNNTVSFYSILCENPCSKSMRNPCLEFTSPMSTSCDYYYANRVSLDFMWYLNFPQISLATGFWYWYFQLHFQMFYGFEEFKPLSSRVLPQRVVMQLFNLKPTQLPNKAVMADYAKMVEGVNRLGANLSCQVIRGPSLALEGSSDGKKSTTTLKQNGRSE